MMVKNIRWSASNMVGGIELCVRTRAGWVAADGTVYDPGLGRFTASIEVSPVVMRRVRRELAEVAS